LVGRWRRRRDKFGWCGPTKILLGVGFIRGARGAVGGEWFVGFDVAPGAAVASHHLVSNLRTPATGGIVWKIAGGESFPNVEHRLNDAPAGFDHVRALKKSGVADHAVVEKAFVARAVRCAEVAGVVEIHVDEAELHRGARNFCTEAEGDAFFGLNVNDEAIGTGIFYWRAAK